MSMLADWISYPIEHVALATQLVDKMQPISGSIMLITTGYLSYLMSVSTVSTSCIVRRFREAD